jgi:cobalt-zinc-cadmium resistance protein CzcA
MAAQRVQTQVIEAQYAVRTQQLQQQLLTARTAIQQHASAADYYDDQRNTVQAEIGRIATLNYQAGEISYFELVSSLNLLASTQRKYWEQVLLHNQAVAYYQYISK